MALGLDRACHEKGGQGPFVPHLPQNRQGPRTAFVLLFSHVSASHFFGIGFHNSIKTDLRGVGNGTHGGGDRNRGSGFACEGFSSSFCFETSCTHFRSWAVGGHKGRTCKDRRLMLFYCFRISVVTRNRHQSYSSNPPQPELFRGHKGKGL